MEKDLLVRKLAVILHADVVGSTTLVQKNEAIAHNRMQAAFTAFAETIKQYGGIAHEIRGDALVAEFDRTSDAVAASLRFQIENDEENAVIEDDIKPEVRIGISLGEVIVADNTVTGAGVVLAQRLEHLATPGGLVVQGSVSETVPGRMPFEFEFLGEQELKGFEKPVRAFAVKLSEGATLPAPEARVSSDQDRVDDSNVSRKFSAKDYEALMGEGLTLPVEPSIAVLPFQNMSGDAEQEYFADGIAEDIITTLSLIPEMVVIARNSSFVYKGRSVDVREVGKELGVAHVLEGSIRKSGDRVRITAQLVDTITGNHAWAARYDRKLDDVFAIQDEITRSIVNELQVKIGKGELVRILSVGTFSLEAWELIMRANRLMEGNSQDDLAIAKKLVQQAIAIDRSFSSAWTAMAWIHWNEAVFKWSADPEDALQKSLNAAQNAIAANENDSNGYSALGNVYMVQGDSKRAIETCQKAVEISPGNSLSMALYANVLLDSGQVHEATQRIKRAIRLCPFPPGWYFELLGVALHLDRKNEVAIRALHITAERESKAFMPRVWMASALSEMGNLKEAQKFCTAALELQPNFSTLEFTKTYRSKSHARLKENLLAAGFPE